MPSIHRQPGRPYWFCAFSIFDSQTHKSRRVFRSTKTTDKKQALEICRTWHKAALKARNGLLNEDSARAIIAQGVSDVLLAASTESLPSASIKSWCESWLRAKAVETEESTQARYKRVIERFTETDPQHLDADVCSRARQFPRFTVSEPGNVVREQCL